ncbi:MAG: hypothetical protein GF334_00400, partial [Candidatus Altiarchaeales archaeon]|nr:hypothetical protein [Candidatus Altiarchaeales archaeon]
TKGKGESEKKIIQQYQLNFENVRLSIKIVDVGDFVYHYLVSMPKIDFVTRALLDETKRALIGEVNLESREIFDSTKFHKIKRKFNLRAKERLRDVLKKASEEYVSVLSQLLVNEMLGLGDLEYLMMDEGVEEVVVNNSREAVWIYHKNHGWLKTNIIIPTEDLIKNYSARVAREVGREITHMSPLLDAHITSGDRVNATLFPVSTKGNTITIRRFSRTPWTAVNMLKPDVNTLNAEAAAFLWMAIEHEMSILVAGGTASGKTTMLNSLMPFMPANQRILSLEDTREINLPEYLQWIPLVVRPPNPEGEGGVTMLDLLENSLRMRPDRVIVGEVRAKQETEVLFEAMHTGHAVYSTFHAEQAREVVDRIISPPMNIPPLVMSSLHLIVVQYRNRRTRKRRTFEIVELTKEDSGAPTLHTLYKWDSRSDALTKRYPSIRVKDELSVFSGLSEAEIAEDLEGKQQVLNWLLKKNIVDVNRVGRVVTEYYLNKDRVLELARQDKDVVLE